MASQFSSSKFVKAPTVTLLVKSGLVAVTLSLTFWWDALPVFSHEVSLIKLEELREYVISDICVDVSACRRLGHEGEHRYRSSYERWIVGFYSKLMIHPFARQEMAFGER